MADGKFDLEKINYAELPIGEAEDVAFLEELADDDDRIAQQRAKDADERARGQQRYVYD